MKQHVVVFFFLQYYEQSINFCSLIFITFLFLKKSMSKSHLRFKYNFYYFKITTIIKSNIYGHFNLLLPVILILICYCINNRKPNSCWCLVFFVVLCCVVLCCVVLCCVVCYVKLCCCVVLCCVVFSYHESQWGPKMGLVITILINIFFCVQ